MSKPKPWKPGPPFWLSKPECDALLEALHLHECTNASLASGRIHRRKTMQKLAEQTFVVEHAAPRVDGDGLTIEPERYGRAWMLTVAGLDVAKHLRQMQEEEWKKQRAAAAPRDGESGGTR